MQPAHQPTRQAAPRPGSTVSAKLCAARLIPESRPASLPHFPSRTRNLILPRGPSRASSPSWLLRRFPTNSSKRFPEELNVPAARAALRSRHFIIPSDAETFGVMHRLTADFLRSLPEEPEFASFEAACQMVGNVMTSERCQDPKWWPLMNLCRPHAEALFAQSQDAESIAVLSCVMGTLAGLFASARGNYLQAIQLNEQVLRVCSRFQGDEHLFTLNAMLKLAASLRRQGNNLSKARQLEEQALRLRRGLLGEEHPDTLLTMGNLALTLRAQGDLTAARNLQVRVLDITKRLLGEEHPHTLTAINNVALTMRELGDYKAAEEMHAQELAICARVLGDEHQETLTSMNN